MKGWLAGALAASTLALASPSGASTAVLTRPGFDTLSGCPSVALTPCWKPWDATNPFPVTGTFTASFSGFQPTPAYSQLAVGATSARVALPTGTVVIVYNTGANAASVTLGNASVVATGANDIIQPNSWIAFTVGPNVDLAGIEATGAAGTTSLVISGGSGLPTGAGGGGGGGGSGTATGTFTPDNSFSTPLSVTSATGNTTLPASATTGSVVKIYNRGPSQIFYQLGTSGVTATTSNAIIPPNSSTSVIVKAGQTNIAAITSTTGLTSTVNVESGTGLPADTGGPANASVFSAIGLVGVSWTNMGATDNAGHTIAIPATAPGTAATGAALPIQGVTGGVPVPISGSVTASFSQFAPNGNFSTPLVVGASSARVALPSGGGSTVGVYNVGANAAFVRLGTTSVVATGVEDQIAPGGFMCFAVGSNVDIAAIETAGATTLNISGGSGGCAGSGGGGGGGAASSVLVNNTTLQPVPTTPANIADTNVKLDGTNAVALLGVVPSTTSIPISISTAVTTQLVAANGSQAIYVNSWDAIANGTTTFTFEYGTGTLCATGTHALTGPYGLVAQFGAAKGDGLGTVLFVPAGNALCAVNSAAVQVSGSLTYAQQ